MTACILRGGGNGGLFISMELLKSLGDYTINEAAGSTCCIGFFIRKKSVFQSPCRQHFKWRRCQCLDALSSSEVEINYSRNVSYLSCQGTAAKTWYMTRKRWFFGTFCFTQEHAVCYLSWVKCGGVQWVLLTFYITEYLPAVKLHFSSSSSASLYNIGRNLQ